MQTRRGDTNLVGEIDSSNISVTSGSPTVKLASPVDSVSTITPPSPVESVSSVSSVDSVSSILPVPDPTPKAYLSNLNIHVSNLPTQPLAQQGVIKTYADAAIQTESKILWQSFKDWLRDVFSVPSSDISSFGHSRVEKWRI